MFDYVTSKPTKSEKPDWFGVFISAGWILYGAVAIMRHRVIGWPIVVLWAIALLVSIRRLIARRRGEAREITGTRNG